MTGCVTDAARQQGSRCFELRAATTLAEHFRKRGRKQQAYQELSPVYGWFTEGFDTPDLRQAARILESCQ
jgi:predicted ATPase